MTGFMKIPHLFLIYICDRKQTNWYGTDTHTYVTYKIQFCFIFMLIFKYKTSKKLSPVFKK